MQYLNDTILEVIADKALFPGDKGYRFTPTEREPEALHVNPRDPIYDGVYQNIVHPVDGIILAKKSPEDEVTYCCGVSFEAWFYALQKFHKENMSENLNPLSILSSEELLNMVNVWFCPVMGHDGMVTALSSTSLGEIVPSLSVAKPGDLIQYWRSVDLDKPSGHSAIFLNYDAGTHVLTYWSSQRKTNGIGENTEVVVPNVWKIYIIRPFVKIREDS